MPRAWLRGRKNVHNRSLVHISSCNLCILIRALFGAGSSKEAAVIRTAFLFVIQKAITVVIVALFDADVVAPWLHWMSPDQIATSSPGC